MHEKTILLNDGRAINVTWREERMRAHIPNADYDTSLLVYWDEKERVAVVDVDAPDWYKPLAALHEAICCGRMFEDRVPGLIEKGLRHSHHCAYIERYCMIVAGHNRRRYAAARREMYYILLEYGLCATNMREEIKRSYELVSSEF